ncbi:transposable element Tc1 transposase [Trichonephila clavipes]|nr:transposable element Tc1 transposase [Trichonephila clavipes]
MQEGTTDRRGRSYPLQCTTSREDRKIVRIAVTDRSVTSRTIAQHIESNASFSVCAYHSTPFTAEWSVRKTSIAWSLTQNHRRLRRQWCDERGMWVAELNEIVFTDESRICLQHHDGRIRVWRHHGERKLNSCVMHCHTGPAPGIMKRYYPKKLQVLPKLEETDEGKVIEELISVIITYPDVASFDTLNLSQFDWLEIEEFEMQLIDFQPSSM